MSPCVATHGTGLTVGNLAALVVGLKFVSGEGKVCSICHVHTTPHMQAHKHINTPGLKLDPLA